MSQSRFSKKKPYKVTDTGPLNIGGVLRRQDDVVFLSDVEARSYAAHIKKHRAQKDEDGKK